MSITSNSFAFVAGESISGPPSGALYEVGAALVAVGFVSTLVVAGAVGAAGAGWLSCGAGANGAASKFGVSTASAAKSCQYAGCTISERK